MHIHQNATPANLATVLFLAQVPLRGQRPFSIINITFRSEASPPDKNREMAEGAAAAQGESAVSVTFKSVYKTCNKRM